MAKILFDTGAIVVSIRHLLMKPDGSLYYQRRIPADLKPHYGNKHRILESLRTRSPPEAARKIKVLTKRDDSLWEAMRASSSNGEEPIAPPVIRFQAEALLKQWRFEPGVKREWYQENFADKMLEKYGNDWYEADGIERDALLTPVEREAWRLLNETPEQRKATSCVYRCFEYLPRNPPHPKRALTKFRQGTERALQIAIGALGDRPRCHYPR
jgi:hypothetical protein